MNSKKLNGSKKANGSANGSGGANEWRVKVGLAEMLKGGVIMDVTNAEQAKIAENAGACAVMALERVPSDIRKEGGVARMASIKVIREIMATVTIPVMAKVRIGHFAEAEVLQALEVDFIDESEVLTPADEENHIWKHDYRVPFVCGARNLGEALRRIAEGAAMIRTKGEAGSGNVVEAVRHMRTIVSQMKKLTTMRDDELMREAKELGAPLELIRGSQDRKIAGAQFLRRRHRYSRGRCAGAPSRRGSCFRGLGNFQVQRSGNARESGRQGHHPF
jgi:pyridoxal 5'-phosphate synthase subunit Pdx1